MAMLLSSTRLKDAQALVSEALQHHPDDDHLLEAAQILLRDPWFDIAMIA